MALGVRTATWNSHTGEWRQEDSEFQASNLGYIVRLCRKHKQNKMKNHRKEKENEPKRFSGQLNLLPAKKFSPLGGSSTLLRRECVGWVLCRTGELIDLKKDTHTQTCTHARMHTWGFDHREFFHLPGKCRDCSLSVWSSKSKLGIAFREFVILLGLRRTLESKTLKACSLKKKK